MTKEKYHHGNLKKELLSKGLKHLNEAGYDGFSIRKVASLCEVSHGAPYRHFKNKDDFINAIVFDVTKSFTQMLYDVYSQYPGDSKSKLIEMGKRYVEFMVENPDYFKFIFLTDHNSPIIIQKDAFLLREGHAFDIVRKCANDYYDTINMDIKYRTTALISFWSTVHGFTSLIAFNTISYQEGYTEIIQKLLDTHLDKDRLYYDDNCNME